MDAIVIPSQYDINAIIEGYAKGYFLMSDDDGHGLGWYSSRQRTLIPLDDRFRYPKSLRRVLKSTAISNRHQPKLSSRGGWLRRT